MIVPPEVLEEAATTLGKYVPIETPSKKRDQKASFKNHALTKRL
jgi:hypothetical protein